MKCLVTGGGGFIGSELVRQLIGRGHKVRVLLRKREIPSNLNGIEAEIFLGDIRDKDIVWKIVKGVDVVFHTASIYESTPFHVRYPKHLYEVNVEGTRNICEAALQGGVKKLVYTSSTAAVGLRDDGKPADESIRLNFLAKRSHYEKSKAIAEEVALSYHQKNLWVVAINPSFLIGPGDIRPTPTGEIIVKFLNRVYPCYFDGIVCLSDLTSAAKAHIDALELGKSGNRYIVAMDQHYSIRELFEEIEKVSRIKAPRAKVPLRILFILSLINEAVLGILGLRRRFRPIVPFELMRYLTLRCSYDSSKAKKELGFRSRSIGDILRESVEWYMNNELIKVSSQQIYFKRHDIQN